MQSLSKILLDLSLISLFLLVGCTATTTRTYNLPCKYVGFATEEACSTAGFFSNTQNFQIYPIRTNNNAMQIQGDRDLMIGFFVGQGGEHINVTVTELNQTTTVTILSKKIIWWGWGLLAQRHMQNRVAEYIDLYLKENENLKDIISK